MEPIIFKRPFLSIFLPDLDEFWKEKISAPLPTCNIRKMSGDALMSLCKDEMKAFHDLAKGGIEPVGILFRCSQHVPYFFVLLKLARFRLHAVEYTCTRMRHAHGHLLADH